MKQETILNGEKFVDWPISSWDEMKTISAKAHGGNMGTFSILFGMVLRSSPPTFSFKLFSPNFTKKRPNVIALVSSDQTGQVYGSESTSTSIREPISDDYQCTTKPRSA